MKDEIEKLIREYVSIWYAADSKGHDLDLAHFDLRGVGEAAQAVADWIERQPVDRVRAMALFVRASRVEPGVFFVPGTRLNIFTVEGDSCSLNGYPCKQLSNCEHIRAVELWMRWNENDQR